MMKSKKSSRWQSLKAVVVVPIAAMAVVAFANPKVKSVTEEVVAETKVAPDNVFTVVQKMPEFPGETSGLLEYLQKNVKFPQTLEDSDIEGTVIVSFIVRKDGSIDDVKVMRGVHPDLDAEAKRVVEAMPKWNAGTQNGKTVNVRYVLPIKFKNNQSESKKKQNMVVIDGVKSTYEDFLKLKETNTAYAVSFLRGKEATDLYGEEAKDGVIIVKIKKD